MTEEEKMKLLYERYNKCRDLELDRFWKNSTFVWVFLAVCFGAFGTVLLKYFSEPEDSKKEILIIFLSVISYCGFFLSRIWTWMARGLKAWFEVYEVAIWNIESSNNVFNLNKKYTIENYWFVKSNGVSIFNSDRISPSRLVILIGHLLSIVWLVAFIKCLWVYGDCCICWGLPNCHFWGWLLTGLAICFFCYKKGVFSSTLRNQEEERVFALIKNDLEHYKVSNVYYEVKNGFVSFWGSEFYKILKHIYFDKVHISYKKNTFKIELDEMIKYYSYSEHLRNLLSNNIELSSKKIIRHEDCLYLYANENLFPNFNDTTDKDLPKKIATLFGIKEQEINKWVGQIKYLNNKLIIPTSIFTIPNSKWDDKIKLWLKRNILLFLNAII